MCSHNKTSSAFSGYIPEIPFIFVDNFTNQHQSAYFLSHYHGDHVCGLKAKDLPFNLKKNKSFIYASEVTVAIIKKEVPELIPYVKSLNLGRNTVTICEDDKELYLSVTALPAGHSLGSIMLLFEHNQTILYTGDFRITQNGVAKYTHLHKNGEPIHIDTLYVDTTFQTVLSFPRRSEVVRNVIIHVQNWLNSNKENKVVFVTSASFGYEIICNKVFSATKIKTYIPDKWEIFSQFRKEMYGITNDPTSRIHLITKYSKSYIKTSNILFIYFSAYKWREEVHEEHFIDIKENNQIDVCFSTHCGRDELLHFINYFRPKKVVGFPIPFDEDENVKTNLNSLSVSITPSKRIRLESESDSPKLSRKISKDVLKNMFDW